MTRIVKVIYWVSITFLLLVAASITASMAHCQNPQYRQPSFVDHPQSAIVRELSSGGGTAVVSGDNNSNVPTPPSPEPLGSAARRLKAEHDGKPKAKVVYVN
jgi:hypothetical protein